MNPTLLRRGAAAVLCTLLAAELRAQLPSGDYLLQDPTRTMLGVATAYVDYNLPCLDLAWIDADGNLHEQQLIWCPELGTYCNEYPLMMRFHWHSVDGGTQFTFDRENLGGAGWITIMSGSMS
jgi:hypothetical protein